MQAVGRTETLTAKPISKSSEGFLSPLSREVPCTVSLLPMAQKLFKGVTTSADRSSIVWDDGLVGSFDWRADIVP